MVAGCVGWSNTETLRLEAAEVGRNQRPVSGPRPRWSVDAQRLSCFVSVGFGDSGAGPAASPERFADSFADHASADSAGATHGTGRDDADGGHDPASDTAADGACKRNAAPSAGGSRAAGAVHAHAAAAADALLGKSRLHLYTAG